MVSKKGKENISKKVSFDEGKNEIKEYELQDEILFIKYPAKKEVTQLIKKRTLSKPSKGLVYKSHTINQSTKNPRYAQLDIDLEANTINRVFYKRKKDVMKPHYAQLDIDLEANVVSGSIFKRSIKGKHTEPKPLGIKRPSVKTAEELDRKYTKRIPSEKRKNKPSVYPKLDIDLESNTINGVVDKKSPTAGIKNDGVETVEELDRADSKLTTLPQNLTTKVGSEEKRSDSSIDPKLSSDGRFKPISFNVLLTTLMKLVEPVKKKMPVKQNNKYTNIVNKSREVKQESIGRSA